MHCPRCGQQQSSTETKFCSRCGFQLGLVSELLEHDGFLPQLAELYSGKRSLFTRRNGIIFSILWFIAFVLMFPAVLGVLKLGNIAGLPAVFGLFTSMMLLIASLAFLKPARQVNKALEPIVSRYQSELAGADPSHAALPPQRSQPASLYSQPMGAWRAPDTGELAVPQSVTENTTKLLQKEDE
jgi:hypothetical protein